MDTAQQFRKTQSADLWANVDRKMRARRLLVLVALLLLVIPVRTQDMEPGIVSSARASKML